MPIIYWRTSAPLSVEKAADRIASEDLVAYLASLDDRSWPDYRAGKPISKAQIARLLKPLRVSSGTIRLPAGSLIARFALEAGAKLRGEHAGVRVADDG